MGTHNNFFRHWNQVITINWHLDISQFSEICLFHIYFHHILFKVKRRGGHHGDKVLWHNELAPIGQCDGDCGGERAGNHLWKPILRTHHWLLHCEFDLRGCRCHWPGKSLFKTSQELPMLSSVNIFTMSQGSLFMVLSKGGRKKNGLFTVRLTVRVDTLTRGSSYDRVALFCVWCVHCVCVWHFLQKHFTPRIWCVRCVWDLSSI